MKMRLTDCEYQYQGEETILGEVKKGALVTNGDDDGDASVSLLFWDDGVEQVEGRARQTRMARFRLYDTMVNSKIERTGDGSWRISGESSRAAGHPAYGEDENRVTVLVTAGPDCRGCSHE